MKPGLSRAAIKVGAFHVPAPPAPWVATYGSIEAPRSELKYSVWPSGIRKGAMSSAPDAPRSTTPAEANVAVVDARVNDHTCDGPEPASPGGPCEST